MSATSLATLLLACNSINGVDDLEEVPCPSCSGAQPYQSPDTSGGYQPPTSSSSSGGAATTSSTSGSNNASSSSSSGVAPTLTLTNMTLNGTAVTTITVAPSAMVALSFRLSDTSATCKLNNVAFAGTTTSITAAATNGATNYSLACTTSAGAAASATFGVTVADPGHWYQANSAVCSTFCGTLGKSNVGSPTNMKCASGENRPPATELAMYGALTYPYGTFGSEVAAGTNRGSVNVNDECYAAGQTQDHDNSDKTVGCFCKTP